MIVGFGYNGFPLNIDDKDPKVNWDNKEEKQKVGELLVRAFIAKTFVPDPA
jgi:hypothetical protein